MRILKAITLATSALALAGTLATSAGAAEKIRWKMGSAFPSRLAQLGSGGVQLSEQLELISGGNIKIKFFEPNALVPPLEMFDSISTGSLDAAWSTRDGYALEFPGDTANHASFIPTG